jgi:hypothetical protein
MAENLYIQTIYKLEKHSKMNYSLAMAKNFLGKILIKDPKR